MFVKKGFIAVMVWVCCIIPLWGGEDAAQVPYRKAIAAQVGMGHVTTDQVLELWLPYWHELRLAVDDGTLPPQDAHERLQNAWATSLETVVREEMFYQEAERKFDEMLRRHSMAKAEAMAQGRGGGASPRQRERIEEELRAHFDKQVSQQMEAMIERQINASGSLVQLRETISRRGLNWEEWRERLRRKSFANTYLRAVLQPRVPRTARPAEIRRYYQQHPEEFTKPGKLRFWHLLIRFDKHGGEDGARTLAGKVYGELAGKKVMFEEAVTTYSDDPLGRAQKGLETETTANDPARPWMARIAEAVRQETPGALAPVLVSEIGCHLTMLKSAGAPTRIPFRQAQAQVKRRLHSQRWEEESMKLYQQLRKEVRVEIRTPSFPPAYALETSGNSSGK